MRLKSYDYTYQIKIAGDHCYIPSQVLFVQDTKKNGLSVILIKDIVGNNL